MSTADRKHKHELSFSADDVREAIVEHFRGKDLPIRLGSASITLKEPCPRDVHAVAEWHEHPGEESDREAARVFVQLRIQEILEIAKKNGIRVAASDRLVRAAEKGDHLSIDLTPETLRVVS